MSTTEKFLVLFNDSTQHHWDFATEGITSALFLSNRPEETAKKQLKNFGVINDFLLRFFNRYLKDRNDFAITPETPTIIETDGM